MTPVPLLVNGVDSGLCESCTYVYDERLYHDQLRKNWRADPARGIPPLPDNTDDLDTILRVVSEDYRNLVASSAPR
jgi:hypothetical protein